MKLCFNLDDDVVVYYIELIHDQFAAFVYF